jgi:hypothetical protein
MVLSSEALKYNLLLGRVVGINDNARISRSPLLVRKTGTVDRYLNGMRVGHHPDDLFAAFQAVGQSTTWC